MNQPREEMKDMRMKTCPEHIFLIVEEGSSCEKNINKNIDPFSTKKQREEREKKERREREKEEMRENVHEPYYRQRKGYFSEWWPLDGGNRK